jgi:hypothetical protein
MTKPIPVIHECPRCGQGGLEAVRIRTSPPIEAVVCAECDTVWLAPRKVGFQFDGRVSEVLPGIGVEPSWSSFESISEGIPWERLDVNYQMLLTRNPPST